MNLNDHHIKRKQTQKTRQTFIIAEIIDIAKNGCTKTHIMFQARLSFTQLNQNLKILTQTGLLEKTLCDSREIYKSTEKGHRLHGKTMPNHKPLNGASNSHVKTSFEFNLHPQCQALRISHNPFSSVITIKNQDLK